jgi:hypothetical protein
MSVIVRNEKTKQKPAMRTAPLVWYTVGSKPNKCVGAGVYGYDARKTLSFSLGKYITVFQAEVYAIRACTTGNLDRGYRNVDIYILSDSCT